jgi:hypothetical protein
VSPIFIDGSKKSLHFIILSACLDWKCLSLLRCSFTWWLVIESGETGSELLMLAEVGTGGDDKVEV